MGDVAVERSPSSESTSAAAGRPAARGCRRAGPAGRCACWTALESPAVGNVLELGRLLAASAQSREAAVPRDREEPRLECDLAVADAEAVVGRYEGLLDGILGFLERGEHVAAERQDRPVMAIGRSSRRPRRCHGAPARPGGRPKVRPGDDASAVVRRPRSAAGNEPPYGIISTTRSFAMPWAACTVTPLASLTPQVGAMVGRLSSNAPWSRSARASSCTRATASSTTSTAAATGLSCSCGTAAASPNAPPARAGARRARQPVITLDLPAATARPNRPRDMWRAIRCSVRGGARAARA